MSKPEKIDTLQDDLFRTRLSVQLNPKHPLILLADSIDWVCIEAKFALLYQTELGYPPLPIRLMVGLTMLQHMEGLSDEQVVLKWVENPYFQYFCGYDHFQWDVPINPSSLTRWRKRIGEKGVEKILGATIQVAKQIGQVTEKDCAQVIAYTTVMEKAITHPTDSKLLNRSREKLVILAKKHGLNLRQSYTRVGSNTFSMSCRYGHAGQYKRKANHLLTQTKNTPNKLYSLHAQEVECIAKGKAHKRYEFGCEASLVVTHKQGLVLSNQALHGNPYDGHMLKGALSHAESISGVKIERIC